MYAFVCADHDHDDEGVLAFCDDRGRWFPMMGADMDRIASLIPLADEIVKRSGKPYRILHFKLDGEVEDAR
jgi:hypothetical protein